MHAPTLTTHRIALRLACGVSLAVMGCGQSPDPTSLSLSGSHAQGVDGSRVELCHRDDTGLYNLLSVSLASEPAHRSHGDAAVGEPVPGAPSMVFDEDCNPTTRLVTFAFEGVIGLSCFVCRSPSTEFGTGVAPGTRLTGTFTFDPTTPPTPTFEPNRVAYVGVTVEFSVGSETVSGNDPSLARIEIHNGPPSGDSYSLVVGGGFPSGTIAGRSIDQFVWVVSGTESLFSDTSLPLTPAFFGPHLGTRVCLGDCFAGVILEGDISSLTLVP